ncbi:SWIM zinc finger family protein [Saccharopolyspora phatthalungensis]|uniref:Putative Zn finger protein n=1 Tax=Saccharopolyspora phatthalungensis TaxID=664693 RepID=A0A840PZZ5_9PSEU|nr:hypothetical protein [Saccharopolyspora phatthalungensis]MBB5153624.1 putative Zn finger protein [Saccharopolyspora phatthalungensis]
MTEYGATAWGQAWLRLAEPTMVTGIDTRLPKARAIARRDAVHGVETEPGGISAHVTVRGRDYPVRIRFPTWTEEERKPVGEYLKAHPGAAMILSTGDAPDELAAQLASAPDPDQIEIDCPCRESRRPCMHALATYYALVQHIDEVPALALVLRGFQPHQAERVLADRAAIPLEELDARGFFEERPVSAD